LPPLNSIATCRTSEASNAKRDADPELEALSAGQKAMIRFGPKDAAVLNAKLREIRYRVAGPVVAR
jgi:hypothetical protein